MLSTIRHKLIAGFSLVLLLAGVTITMASYELHVLNDDVEDLVGSDMNAVATLADIQVALLQQRILLREAILSRQGGGTFSNADSLRKSQELGAAIKGFSDKLPALATDDKDRQIVGELTAAINGMLQDARRIEDAVGSGGDFESLINPAVESRNAAATLVGSFFVHKKAEAEESAKAAAADYRVAQTAMVVLGLLMLVVGGGTAIMVLRSVIPPLRKAVGVTEAIAEGNLDVSARHDSACEVGQMMRAMETMRLKLNQALRDVATAAGSSRSLSDQLSGQATEAAQRSQAAAEQIMQLSAAMEQMSVAIEEIASSSHSMHDASAEAHRYTEDGRRQMASNLQAVDQIVTTVAASEAAIGHLCEAANKIGNLTQLIRDIADQTNLLALNAAIEAARAGEAGRGFAVVADEVRKLAENTRKSSGDIETLVAALSTGTEDAMASMARVKADVEAGAGYTRDIEKALTDIAASAATVSGLVQHIASATTQQKSASEMTARTMEDIATITEENDAVIQNVATASKELSATSENLAALVARFRLAA